MTKKIALANIVYDLSDFLFWKKVWTKVSDMVKQGRWKIKTKTK
jgi:hypothetical protein